VRYRPGVVGTSALADFTSQGVSANLEYQCVKPVRLAVTDPLLYEACKPDNGFGSRGGNVWRVSHEDPR